ncbi:MAG: tetratricopeptide repeat protein, partial [Candidatus Acidiferrales bacterium]
MNRTRFTTVGFGAVVACLFVAPLLFRGESQQSKENAKAGAKADAVLRSNNLGVAYMDQQRPEDALKEFQQAVIADSGNYVPQLNAAIALLNMQRADEARKILAEITQSHPEDAHGWYNL